MNTIVPYPLPDDLKRELVAAGVAACSHFPGHGGDFNATVAYRRAHDRVEEVLARIRAWAVSESTITSGEAKCV